MSLIIEDGTGLANAEAYADVTTVLAYAMKRGYTLPTDPTVIEPLIVKATDYLESLDYILQAYTQTQALSWPRNLHGMFNFPMPPYYNYEGVDVTQPQYPQEKLQAAQSQLVIEQQINGVDLQPTTVGGSGYVIEERVDVIMTRYSERLGTLQRPTLRAVDAILRDLVLTTGKGAMLRTVRV